MNDTKRAVDIVMDFLDVIEPAQEEGMDDPSGLHYLKELIVCSTWLARLNSYTN